ncbi:MAG TPA: hypothetical protein VE860_04205 [Chthoniobacterales bacterium]|jgi:adenosine/AMP kinase|nr:hypothetical protein [Chthoniobacterales bacterium]
MTKEEIIPMLEHYIKLLESGEETTDPREPEQQLLGLSLEEAKDCLERVRAGDEDLVEQISEILG